MTVSADVTPFRWGRTFDAFTAHDPKVCADQRIAPEAVVGAWIALLVLASAVAGFGMNLTTSAEFTNDPDSMKGADLLEDRLRGEDPVIETVVIRANAATIDDAAYKSIVEQTTADLRGLDGVVASADDYYETGNTALVSADKRTTLIPVTLAGDVRRRRATQRPSTSPPSTAEPPSGFEVLTVGDVSHRRGVQHDLRGGPGQGRGARAADRARHPGRRLRRAGRRRRADRARARLDRRRVRADRARSARSCDLSFFVINMITMIGLAVGIDYALFVVERYREERRRGAAKHRRDRDRRRHRQQGGPLLRR